MVRYRYYDAFDSLHCPDKGNTSLNAGKTMWKTNLRIGNSEISLKFREKFDCVLGRDFSTNTVILKSVEIRYSRVSLCSVFLLSSKL